MSRGAYKLEHAGTIAIVRTDYYNDYLIGKPDWWRDAEWDMGVVGEGAHSGNGDVNLGIPGPEETQGEHEKAHPCHIIGSIQIWLGIMQP